MRIYRDFVEAHGEILRDVTEMGIIVRPKSMQNKVIEGNKDFETLEVQNYGYVVTGPKAEDLEPNQPWADLEFAERISHEIINPGEAWKTRPEVWTEFLEEGTGISGEAVDMFAYSYNERYNGYDFIHGDRHDNLEKIIARIKVDPDSRQLYLSMWQPKDIDNLGGLSRVPCSLGYLFQVRGGKLNMTYTMRSCDAVTHFHNDVYLAFRLQEYIAKETGYEVGNFTHFINSLHIYRKDSQGIF